MTEAEDDGLGRYYVLDTSDRGRLYLPWSEGERLENLLDAWRPGDPPFVKFEDTCGSDCRVQVIHIINILNSTPAIRVRERRDRDARRAADPDWKGE